MNYEHNTAYDDRFVCGVYTFDLSPCAVLSCIAKVQKQVEEIIATEIARFSKALPNKEMHFQGKVELDFPG